MLLDKEGVVAFDDPAAPERQHQGRSFEGGVEAGDLGEDPQGFLLGTTTYIAIASLMVFHALVLPPRVNRIANIAMASIYALTIIAGAIGEWKYYILGSAIEVGLLASIVYCAWTWPNCPPGFSRRGW